QTPRRCSNSWLYPNSHSISLVDSWTPHRNPNGPKCSKQERNIHTKRDLQRSKHILHECLTNVKSEESN
ncbi:hypothetical protein WICPIJ_005245, partial [Wickerhamomyces pijperi]